MVKSILFISRAAFSEMQPTQKVAAISIRSAYEPPVVDGGWGLFLPLVFSDAEWDEEMICPSFKPAETGFPTLDSLAPVHSFLAALKKGNGIEQVVVHCEKGQRRSAAVARYIAEQTGLDDFPFDYLGFNKTVYRLLKS